MPKAKYNKLAFIPKSYNMSEMDLNISDKNSVGITEQDTLMSEDLEDERDEQDSICNNVFADEVVVQILFNLKDREKVIFMFQLLRESGFEIDYGSAAQTMGIQRQSYMKMLSTVKKKAMIVATDAYKAR
jgi:hypothetical protein